MSTTILWYFADPMCSWCWGFSPTMEVLRDQYRDHMRTALVLGGLRPGTTEPMTPSARDDILHHWHAVHARTEQPFDFDRALPHGFVYDTEPACRAVVAMGELDPAGVFPLFKAIQHAFYAEARDVTQTGVLTELAANAGADASAFQRAFGSDGARSRTQAHFRQARQAGVTGFPALILQQDDQLHSVSQGCLPLDTVRAAIDQYLQIER